MNVITVASRKGGAGKTTITAHLAALAHAQGHRCLVIDADPQGSLSLCNVRRAQGALPLTNAERGVERQVAIASILGYEWVFIDTAPTMWVVVQEAIRAATLVLIPARPSFLDLDSVRETGKAARDRGRPYAVVLNACPPKREGREAPLVQQARAWLRERDVPVFSGQISQRAGFAMTLADGASVGEAAVGSFAAEEIADLWAAVKGGVAAINAATEKAAAALRVQAA